MNDEQRLFVRRVLHSINNPLTGILGYCQLLLQEPGLSPFQREALEHIQAQSRRCRSILKELLPQTPAPQAKKMLISEDDEPRQNTDRS